MKRDRYEAVRPRNVAARLHQAATNRGEAAVTIDENRRALWQDAAN